MRKPNELHSALCTALKGFQSRLLLLELAIVGMGGALAVTVFAWCWILLESLFHMPPSVRLSMGIFVVLSTVVAVLFQAVRLLTARLSLVKTALLIEDHCPQLQQRLITSLELDGETRTERFSRSLLRTTLERAVADLEALDLRALLPWRDFTTASLRTGGTALVAGISLLLFDDSLGAAAVRCTHPLTVFEWEPRTQITIKGEGGTVVKGDDYHIKIRFKGDLPEEATILSSDELASDFSSQRLLVGGADSLYFTFEHVKRSFEFMVAANDGESSVHNVDVIAPPYTEKIRLHYRYPNYSGQPPRIEEGNGDIRGLRGTRVEIELFASKPLESATVVIDDSVRLEAEVLDVQARVDVGIESSGSYSIELRDRVGTNNRNPIRYSIHAIDDNFPQVTLTQPGQDVDLPDNMVVPLTIEAVDDYGISELTLLYNINESGLRSLPLNFKPGTDVRVGLDWDLSRWDLLPEDLVRYRVTVFDNDAVSGPKKSSTPEYLLRFPSLQELFNEIRDVQGKTLDHLEKLAEQSAETGEYFEELRRELLKEDALTWEQERELASTLTEETERARAVEELARSIEEARTALSESGIVSDELLDKMAELSELMEMVMSPQLQEALAALQQAAKRQNPRQLADAMRKFAEDHQSFEEHLDRTIALLEKVQAEQRLHAAVKRMEELEGRQARINERMNFDIGDPRLPQHERALQRDTEALQSELSELADIMDEYSEKTATSLLQQAERMQKEELVGRMQKIVQLLEAPANSEARQKGSEMQRDLSKLTASLQHLQGEYTAEQKKELSRAMRAAVHELVRLSERQENVATITRRARDEDSSHIAATQFSLAQGTALVVEKLGSVARRTMSLGYGLSTSLGYAMQLMGTAADRLGRKQLRDTDEQQLAAMGYLNESVMLLRQSMENLADARMPSSFAEAMQKMAGLAEQQSDINQASQKAFGLQGKEAGERDRVGVDHQHRMKRLTAAQRNLHEALRVLERSLRGHRGAEERARIIEREMQAVLQDLQGPQLKKRTLNLQNRIHQRMLDASRSIHNRGFEKKRTSESGINLGYSGPPWLPKDRGESEDLLREAMRNALAGPYPETYRRLIRSYYERVYQDVTETVE